MRKLNGFIITCVLAMVCSSANAQIQIVIDNQTIPTEDIESIVILPNSNLISVTTSVAYTVQASSAEPPPPGSVSITGFSASPSPINEGQSTTLSWTTANATSCTPSGGTGGWNTRTIALPNSSATITISTANTYTFTLTCQGSAGDSVTKNATVTVNTVTDPGTTTCSNPTISGNVQSWNNFWGTGFPMPKSDSQFMSIPIKGYVALKFNTGSVIDDGKISSIETTTTTGVRLGSFSACPGDFEVPAECKLIWGLGGGIRWATNGRDGACDLAPNTTYYFNITYTDGISASTTTCLSSPCVTNMQHSNR